MKFPVTTTLQRIRDVGADDFGISRELYWQLYDAQVAQAPVTVHCEACEGYYDITLADGTEFPAVSAYHLVGFEDLS